MFFLARGVSEVIFLDLESPGCLNEPRFLYFFVIDSYDASSIELKDAMRVGSILLRSVAATSAVVRSPRELCSGPAVLGLNPVL